MEKIQNKDKKKDNEDKKKISRIPQNVDEVEGLDYIEE